jgi:hypothetical protein
MKTPLCLIALTVAFTLGCSPKAHTFRVTAATPDQRIDVVGTFEGKEYALSVDRKENHVPTYSAYFEPIATEDVGKEFHATVKNGEIAIDLPKPVVVDWLAPDKKVSTVYYTIEAARVK